MKGQKPIFRVMKDGYDRFAVDDAVDNYEKRIQMLENEVGQLKKELNELQDKHDILKQEYSELSASVSVNSTVKEDIIRAAVMEANEVIGKANDNANRIVDEALSNAAIIIEHAKRYSR